MVEASVIMPSVLPPSQDDSGSVTMAFDEAPSDFAVDPSQDSGAKRQNVHEDTTF